VPTFLEGVRHLPKEDEPQFPANGILWRGWNEKTLAEIAQREKPVLLFISDADPFVSPFLREMFYAMPVNETLRALLHESFIPLFINADELPEELKAFGAGSRYHIAILSPYGLTPMVTMDTVQGNPAKAVAGLAQALERLASSWQ
jgi:hypothetical protein